MAGIVRDLDQIVARYADQIDEERRQAGEHRQFICQIYARMEQHDARMAEHDADFDAMSLDIRRILETIDCPGGNGGRRGGKGG